MTGESNLFAGTQTHPITNALNFPDRSVRFEAAFALAGALPQKPFEGQSRVVPILTEAIAQTGRPNVLIVLPTPDMVNAVAESIKDQYGVAGATSAGSCVERISTAAVG